MKFDWEVAHRPIKSSNFNLVYETHPFWSDGGAGFNRIWNDLERKFALTASRFW